MKKTTIAIIAAAMLCGLASCGNKVSVHDNGSSTAPTKASTEASDASAEGTAAASGAVSSAKTTSSAESTTTASGANAANQPEPREIFVNARTGLAKTGKDKSKQETRE